jgi:predicted dehydrogenase
MLKAAVIGTGWAAEQHIMGYQKLPDVNVAAICGNKSSRLNLVSEKYSVPHRYNDYRSMLANELPDLVRVCTPNYLHAEMSIYAMEKGASVICEKPMATNAVDADRMIHIMKQTGKLLTIANQRRFEAGTTYLKNMIDNGSFGDIYHINAKWIRRQGIPGMGGWFTNKSQSGGGALIDIGVHVLDLAMWFMGFPEVLHVESSYGNRFGSRGLGAGEYNKRLIDTFSVFDVDDYAFAHIKFSEGRSIQLQCSWAAHIKSDDVNIEIWGESAGAKLYPLEIFSMSPQNELTDIRPQLKGKNAFDEQIKAFCESVTNGKPAVYDPCDGLKVMKLIEMIYRNEK